jgi:hypothetical protein
LPAKIFFQKSTELSDVVTDYKWWNDIPENLFEYISMKTPKACWLLCIIKIKDVRTIFQILLPIFTKLFGKNPNFHVCERVNFNKQKFFERMDTWNKMIVALDCIKSL